MLVKLGLRYLDRINTSLWASYFHREINGLHSGVVLRHSDTYPYDPVCPSAGRWVGWLVGRLVGWSVGGSVGRSVGLSATIPKRTGSYTSMLLFYHLL